MTIIIQLEFLMRYGKDHKEATRRRVLAVAASRFRRDGLDGVGVAALMAEAGLTHGGFYSHFASKEALIAEVFASGLDETLERGFAEWRKNGLESLIRHYLSLAHRDHPETGCPAAALVGEIRRHPKPTRAAFTRKLKKVIAHISSLLPEPDENTAAAIFSLLVGGLQLARAVSDPQLSADLLKASAESASALAQRSKSRRKSGG